MITLAIDIGGTKFTMAIFDGERMVERESEARSNSTGNALLCRRM
jgi:predicted NBD/HSP70 family sugar kinase